VGVAEEASPVLRGRRIPHRAAFHWTTRGPREYGFATIVAWGGNLSFTGTPSQPFTIMGWDRATRSPAADVGSAHKNWCR